MGGRNSSATMFGLRGVGVVPGELLPDGISNFICDRSWPLALAASLNRTRPKLTDDMDERSVSCVRPEATEVTEAIDGSETPLEATAGDWKPGSMANGLAEYGVGPSILTEGAWPGPMVTSLISPGVGCGAL